MAGFTENLKVEIESIFNARGFNRLQANLNEIQAELAKTQSQFQALQGSFAGSNLGDAFEQAEGLRNARRESERMNKVLQEAGLEESPLNNVFAKDAGTGDTIPNVRAVERIADAQERLQGGTPLRSSFAGLSSPMEMMDEGFDPEQFQPAGTDRLGRSLGMQGVRMPALGVLSSEMSQIGQTTSVATSRVQRFKNRAVSGLSNTLSKAAGSTRALQMRLLGLQFTMLTVAFIFGGLLASALGAVGVFKVLGNTLKFLFLPTALNVLGGMLGIQEAVMGMDEETRQLIGDIFLWISVFAIIIGLAAALGKALLSVVGFLKFLAPLVKGIIALLNFFGAGISTVVGAIVPLLAFLAGLVGAFLVVVRVAKKFGDIMGLIAGIILTIVGIILLVIGSILSLPVVIAAAVGIIIGAILGLVWVFRDQLWGAVVWTFNAILGAIQWLIDGFFGLVDFIVGIFGWLAKKLVGNSIIPDMVKSIIGFIMSIPKKIIGLGASIVDVIVQGIKSAGTAIWDAFKKILPDFLVNAIEGAGKAVKGIVKTGGQVVGAAGNVIGSVGQGIVDTAAGIGESVSGVFSGGGSDKPKQEKNVQQNNINAEVQVNDKEETPQETGKQLGKGVNEGLRERQNNTAGGF